MTFVVGEDCIKCKHTDCVEVCPVDCFYEGPNFLVIHPDECIDCALCEPECPIDAIFSEDELPADQENFLALNAELAEIWPNITEKGESPADAAELRRMVATAVAARLATTAAVGRNRTHNRRHASSSASICITYVSCNRRRRQTAVATCSWALGNGNHRC